VLRYRQGGFLTLETDYKEKEEATKDYVYYG
jgi:hypothetical protein